MATKTQESELLTNEDVTAKLYSLVGASFPLQVTTQFGKLVKAKYETEWKEGSPETGYKERSLTPKQIKQLDDWISDNLSS